ncbi:Protein virB10 [Alteripontixanthobacter maritimus]|uniref:Protein virB10 n=1 Tax=Alteripontixanthobacter maritimus TaxID=2161824 RepID=A0A369Q3B5_9SPHN|nr:TrbI/VirB10 family protein [Alteripontixanthobacter maritimus]RDC59383.1 Protein virB10 [Alteripontixanthobacter maritimus]
MRLANKIPATPANDEDPRDTESAEVIDLASRSAFPVVTQRKGKGDGLGMVAGIAIVAGLGALTLWSMNSTRMEEPASVGGQVAAPPVAAQTTQTDLPVPVADAQPVAQTYAAPQYDPSPQPVLSRAPGASVMPVGNPYATPTIVFDASGAAGVTSATPGLASPADGSAASNVGSSGGSIGDFASRIGGVGGATAQATAMANPTTTVTQGTLIPAILETAIDTDVPGYVRAMVSQDVRSFDGTKVLVPRSSRLIGQYQSGVQGGQKRAYVIWTRLIRPDGASVNLASPAIGFDGTTGLPGKVDNKFFKRFGSAMLLSVIGGLSAIGSGGASVVLGGASQSAATVAAQQDSQVGPTIRVKQGEPIRVFTARDLDFSGV